MSDPEHFFEGVEKLLEVWFVPSVNADLRKIPRYVYRVAIRSFSLHSARTA